MRPRVALLPLYLELYDRTLPELLPRQEAFLRDVVSLLGSWGLELRPLPVCRVRAQVAEAVAAAQADSVDGLIALHLAYSPSLETAPVLAGCGLPLLLLDTTPARRFGVDARADDVLANHGIHGVQDLASVLRREGMVYTVAAGGMDEPGLAQKVMDWARAAHARAGLRRLRVAQVGAAFPGMGDFGVSAEWLRDRLGATLVPVEVSRVARLAAAVSAEELSDEMESDRSHYEWAGLDPACWERSDRMALGLRRALGEIEAGAFSLNFASFDRAEGALTVPFLEASKAMARGLGYAGEGDVLTACLVAVLNGCWGATTFTEMFCPDWEGGRVFMSHMGECNPALAKCRPRLLEKDYAFGPTDNPAVLLFPLRPGSAALVNLAPVGEGGLTLIAAEVSICDLGPQPALGVAPHFWIAPPMELASFLEQYSAAGGTHHLALTPGLRAASLRPLAELLGCRFMHLAAAG